MLITSASCTRQCAQVNSGTFLILLLRRCLNFGGGHERNFARGNWPRRRGYRGLFVRRGQCSPPSNRAIGGRTSWAASSLMVETSRSWASAVCAKRCSAHGKPCADGEFTGTAKFVGRKKWRAGSRIGPLKKLKSLGLWLAPCHSRCCKSCHSSPGSKPDPPSGGSDNWHSAGVRKASFGKSILRSTTQSVFQAPPAEPAGREDRRWPKAIDEPLARRRGRLGWPPVATGLRGCSSSRAEQR